MNVAGKFGKTGRTSGGRKSAFLFGVGGKVGKNERTEKRSLSAEVIRSSFKRFSIGTAGSTINRFGVPEKRSDETIETIVLSPGAAKTRVDSLQDAP